MAAAPPEYPKKLPPFHARPCLTQVIVSVQVCVSEATAIILLRAGRERPSGRCAAEDADEIVASHMGRTRQPRFDDGTAPCDRDAGAGPVDGSRRFARRKTSAGLHHAASQKAWRCRKGIPRWRSVISTLLSGAASLSGLRSAAPCTKPTVGSVAAK